MDEEFRDVVGHVGYRVSNKGRVQSRWNRRWGLGDVWKDRKPYRSPSGHLQVMLQGRVARLVHHLVLEAFVGMRPEGMECCHENDNPSDNRLENLRWGTRSDNRRDAKKNGKLTQIRLTDDDKVAIREKFKAGVNYRVIAEEFKITPMYVYQVVNGRKRRTA